MHRTEIPRILENILRLSQSGVTVGDNSKYCGKSGDLVRTRTELKNPDHGRVSMGIGYWNNLDPIPSGKDNSYSWGCQSNDEMTWMTQQQEAGNVSREMCTKK